MPYNKQSNWKRKQTAPPPKPKKVRKLAPLATEEQKQQMQIGDLTYDFACRITRLFQYLTEDSDDKEYIMSKQVYLQAQVLVQTSERQSMLSQISTSYPNIR